MIIVYILIIALIINMYLLFNDIFCFHVWEFTGRLKPQMWYTTKTGVRHIGYRKVYQCVKCGNHKLGKMEKYNE